MMTTKKQHSPKFKARVALEAIREEKTLSQLGSPYGVHPVQIAHWRKAAVEQLPEIFADGAETEVELRGAECRRAVRGDRPAEDGAGLGEKKAGGLE